MDPYLKEKWSESTFGTADKYIPKEKRIFIFFKK